MAHRPSVVSGGSKRRNWRGVERCKEGDEEDEDEDEDDEGEENEEDGEDDDE